MLATTPHPGINASVSQQLLPLALDGLIPMFNPAKRLFCHRLRRASSTMIREGLSPRYTIMTLLGLHRAEAVGLRGSIDVQETFNYLRTDCGWINNVGDLGLTLWLAALCNPENLGTVVRELAPESALERYGEGSTGRTMELAWFLSGLAHVKLSRQTSLPNFTDLALRVYRQLSENQGRDGLFGHLSTSGSLAGRVRGHIGSFADQVYPIYAMSKFALAYGIDDSLAGAHKCATAICRLQGALGQWWWHYNAISGQIAGGYPVYSVHQHGMAPLALYALSEASGISYAGPISAGLEWVCGKNELERDMASLSDRVIWRCIYQSKMRAIVDRIYKLGSHSSSPGKLRVLHECRPYELGWLLYALSGR